MGFSFAKTRTFERFFFLQTIFSNGFVAQGPRFWEIWPFSWGKPDKGFWVHFFERRFSKKSLKLGKYDDFSFVWNRIPSLWRIFVFWKCASRWGQSALCRRRWTLGRPHSPELRGRGPKNAAKQAVIDKSWFSGRGWGQPLFSFQSPAVQWVPRTSCIGMGHKLGDELGSWDWCHVQAVFHTWGAWCLTDRGRGQLKGWSLHKTINRSKRVNTHRPTSRMLLRNLTLHLALVHGPLVSKLLIEVGLARLDAQLLM